MWLVVMGCVALTWLLADTLIPITFRSEGQAGLLSWSSIGVYALLGLVGIWCGRAIGFPAAWDARVSTRQRLALPLVIGLGIGALELGIDVLTAGTKALAQLTGQPSFNIDFPGSVLAYFGGGVQVEIMFRLFSLPFLVWLVSRVVLRGRWLTPTLWVFGAISAGLEPAFQGVALFVMGAGVLTPLMLAGYMATTLPENILAVVLFRRYGLLAPICLRWGEYLVFHILYGNFLYSRVFAA